MTTHISADVQRITLNAISGERTEQLDIFCRITGFTSDFLSFIDVELICFFHGALQLFLNLPMVTMARTHVQQHTSGSAWGNHSWRIINIVVYHDLFNYLKVLNERSKSLCDCLSSCLTHLGPPNPLVLSIVRPVVSIRWMTR